MENMLGVNLCEDQQQQNIINLNREMNEQARTVYNSLINDPKLLPLSSFKSNKFSKYNLFPQAHSLPLFFENNLQSDGRVVKYLKGPEGPFRAFYYQLFKLGFEIENSTHDYASIIKNTIFDPNLCSSPTGPTSGKQYNINQYKRIIAEYIKLMESQVIPNAQLTFNQYPIIDEAMLTILELIVNKFIGDIYVRTQNLFQLLCRLCQIFKITLQIYDSCFSFAQSDVFLYVESKDSFYLAFLSQMAEVQSYEQTSQSQDLKEQSSNSYIQSKQEAAIYKDIRLSAGNRSSRARPLNRSVPAMSKNIYGTSSFGQGQRRSRRTHEEQQISEQEEGKEQHQPEIHDGKENQLQKNVFESGSFDGEEDSRHRQAKLDNNYMNGHQRELKSILEAQRIQSRQIIKSLAQQDHQGSHKSLNSNPGTGSLISVNESPSNNGVPSYSQGHKQVNIYDVKTYKTISDSATDVKQLLLPLYTLQHNQNDDYNIPSHFTAISKTEERKRIIQQVSEDYMKQDTDMKKKTKVKIHDQIFQYEFKSTKYQNQNSKEQNVKLSDIVDKILSNSLIAKAESSSSLPKSQVIIDVLPKPEVVEKNQVNTRFQSPTKKQHESKNKVELGNFNQISSITSPMKTSSNVRTQPSRHTAISSTQIADPPNQLPFPGRATHQINIQPPSPPRISQRQSMQIDFYTPKAPTTGPRYTDSMFNRLKKSENNYQHNPKTDYKLSDAHNERDAKLTNQIEKTNMEDSLGTFYRQFTDTRIMQAMPEPFRTKVRMVRQRFKGIRSKNYRGVL